jgi:hypothetical protein
MKKRVTNMAASVHARLLNRAKAEGRTFNELLQYYGMERFLYRLSRSEHSAHFVLKGALMLQFWGAPLTRATKDIDLLGREAQSVDQLVACVKDCFAVDVEDDGLRFDADSVSGDEIRIDAKYSGVRLTFVAFLQRARIHLQVDVGYGDVVTPEAQDVEYPSLLDFEPPRLLGYTPETAIAEKLHAMVILDMANTRMKDFFDIWVLARGRPFSGVVLADAIAATFRRRATDLPTSAPIALTPTFHSAPVKETQWRAFLRKGRVDRSPSPPLSDVVQCIHEFVMPVIDALAAGASFTRHWSPGGPWVTPGD